MTELAAGRKPMSDSLQHVPVELTHCVMPGLVPRVSGSIFMDRVHDVDSSVF